MIDICVKTARPAGYQFLIEKLALEVRPNWRRSAVAHRVRRRTWDDHDGLVTLPPDQWPGDTIVDHLTFAVRRDGVNPEILNGVFHALSPAEVATFVRRQRADPVVRRLWFLYEWCTGRTLPVDDLDDGRYVPVIDPAEQYTTAGRPVHRQRVYDNLLGGRRFCPTVRRTALLREWESSDLAAWLRRPTAGGDPRSTRRAAGGLIDDEVRASVEMDGVAGDVRLTQWLGGALRTRGEGWTTMGWAFGLPTAAGVLQLRTDLADGSPLHYSGPRVRFGSGRALYVPPSPAAIGNLLDGLAEADARLSDGGNPVIHAAVVAYGCLFVQPFTTHNGLVHRLLLNDALARRGVLPPGVVLPVSAVTVKHPRTYDDTLEAFSVPMHPLVRYTLDDGDRMTVSHQPASLYQFMDLTAQAEGVAELVGMAADQFVDEVHAYRRYDLAKQGIQAVADIPDRMIDLFIRRCREHGGVLPLAVRGEFEKLTEPEIDTMERAVRRAVEATPIC